MLTQRNKAIRSSLKYAICTTSMSNSFKAVSLPYGQREKRACQGLSGPDFILLIRWPLFHCHCSPTEGESGCGFGASGRVSTNAKGCSWNVSLMTGITGTTVSKLIPAKPLATNNLKIMSRISMNIHIFQTPVRLFCGLLPSQQQLGFVFYVYKILCLRLVLSLKTTPTLLWYFQRNYNLITYICPGFNIIRKAYGYAY